MADMKRVVLIVAMEQEAEPFIQKHRLKQMTPSPFMAGMQMVCYSGRINNNANMEVFLVWTGRDQRYKVNNVATTAASVATYASIQAFHPVDLVLSAGTAGGFGSQGCQVGDVFLSTKCVFHGRRIPSAGGDESDTLEEYGFGHFRSPSVPLLATACGLKVGVVSTSDSLDHTPIDLELMRGEGAAVKDMEAAAVAWVCQQVKIPFLAVKSVTDIVDSAEKTVDEEFYANLKTASEALQEQLSQLLEFLSTAPLAHWSGEGGTGSIPAVPVKPAKGAALFKQSVAGLLKGSASSPVESEPTLLKESVAEMLLASRFVAFKLADSDESSDDSESESESEYEEALEETGDITPSPTAFAKGNFIGRFWNSRFSGSSTMSAPTTSKEVISASQADTAAGGDKPSEKIIATPAKGKALLKESVGGMMLASRFVAFNLDGDDSSDDSSDSSDDESSADEDPSLKPVETTAKKIRPMRHSIADIFFSPGFSGQIQEPLDLKDDVSFEPVEDVPAALTGISSPTGELAPATNKKLFGDTDTVRESKDVPPEEKESAVTIDEEPSQSIEKESSSTPEAEYQGEPDITAAVVSDVSGVEAPSDDEANVEADPIFTTEEPPAASDIVQGCIDEVSSASPAAEKDPSDSEKIVRAIDVEDESTNTVVGMKKSP